MICPGSKLRFNEDLKQLCLCDIKFNHFHNLHNIPFEQIKCQCC